MQIRGMNSITFFHLFSASKAELLFNITSAELLTVLWRRSYHNFHSFCTATPCNPDCCILYCLVFEKVSRFGVIVMTHTSHNVLHCFCSKLNLYTWLYIDGSLCVCTIRGRNVLSHYIKHDPCPSKRASCAWFTILIVNGMLGIPA